MLLSIIFLLMPVALLVFGYKFRDSGDWKEGGATIAIIVGVILGLSFYLSLPCCRAVDRSLLIRYQETVCALEESRTKNTEESALERAAILRDVISINVAIGEAQYWNKYFDLWNSDKVIYLKPIR